MQEHEKKRLQIDVAQVVAGAFAAVSAAFIASTLGVMGTLIGAAVMSIVATIGGTLYKHSLERAHEQARTRIRIRRNPRTGEPEQEVLPPPRPRRIRIAWGKVAGMAVLVFVLALGAIIALEEVALGEALSDWVRGTSPEQSGTAPPARSGNTAGVVVGRWFEETSPATMPSPDETDEEPVGPASTDAPEAEPTPVPDTEPTPGTEPTPVLEAEPTPVPETEPTPVPETEPTPGTAPPPTPEPEPQP